MLKISKTAGQEGNRAKTETNTKSQKLNKEEFQNKSKN